MLRVFFSVKIFILLPDGIFVPLILFHSRKSFTATPYLEAIDLKVSPLSYFMINPGSL